MTIVTFAAASDLPMSLGTLHGTRAIVSVCVASLWFACRDIERYIHTHLFAAQ